MSLLRSTQVGVQQSNDAMGKSHLPINHFRFLPIFKDGVSDNQNILSGGLIKARGFPAGLCLEEMWQCKIVPLLLSLPWLHNSSVLLLFKSNSILDASRVCSYSWFQTSRGCRTIYLRFHLLTLPMPVCTCQNLESWRQSLKFEICYSGYFRRYHQILRRPET